MKIGKLRRACLVLWVAVLCVVPPLGGGSGRARADETPAAPPAPAPIAPPEPAAPPESPDHFDPEDLLAWTKRKPVPAPAWRDVQVVEKRFEEALAAVEQECGVKFDVRPTVRISTREDVRKIVRAELDQLPKASGLGDLSPLLLDAEVAGVLAKYELDAHVVHVVPETVEANSGLLGVDLGTEEGLRVVLAHECTHALDFRRFSWGELRKRISGPAELSAFGAIVEGHAQRVARRIASTWNLAPAFDAFTKAIDAVPDGVPEFFRPLFRGMASHATFAYRRGEAFLAAVAAEAGDAGVLRALTTPPKTTREIEHPAEWLHPELASTGLDPAPALSALGALVPSPPWIVQQMDVLEGTIEAQLADAPSDEVAAALRGFREAKGFVAKGLEMETFAVVCMRCSTTAQAQALVAVDRRASEAKDAKLKTGLVRVASSEYAEGTGSGGRWGGWTVRKRIQAGPKTLSVTTAVFPAGAFAFEVLISGRVVEGAWMDRVVDALGAYVTQADRPLPKFPADAILEVQAPPGGLGLNGVWRVRMTVTDAAGKAVPQCGLEVMVESESSQSLMSVRLKDGRGMIPTHEGTADVLLHGAADAEGVPLDLGPLLVSGVDLTASDLKFVLPEGRTVEGRVVDGTGKGVNGAQVQGRFVRSPGATPRSSARVVIASTTTDAEGRYRLRGLGASTRVDVAPPAPLVAPLPFLVEGTGPTVDVVVAEGHSARVTVTDPDGAPVAGAEVRWGRVFRPGPGASEIEWESPEARTDAAGRAELEGLPTSGPLGLSVVPRAGRSLGRFHDWAWDGGERQVTLARVQWIHGRVLDDQGKPPKRATVHLKVGASHHTTPVGPQGLFSFSDVEEGAAVAGVSGGEGEGARTPKVWVPVVPGTPVELVLGAAAAPLTIRGLGAGRSVFTRSGGAEGSVQTRKSTDGGTVSLPGETRGSRIDVFVEPTTDDPRGLVALDVVLAPEGVVLELTPCVATSGTIRADAGFKHLEVHVLAPWRLIPVKVRDDGTFELPPLPPGTYSLRAKARGADSWIYARAEFQPGASLDLMLRPK